jgi:P4 family phage/plasmid primase-like protien
MPDALKAIPGWLVWRYVEDADPKTGVSWDKPPINARTGGPGSSTNRETWSSSEVALVAYESGGLDGLGLALRDWPGPKGLVLVAVDLDHCFEPATGRVEDWALDIIQALHTYTEISPSGHGIRMLCWARLPARGRKKGHYENYSTGRYVTITGQHVDGTPRTIEERPAELLEIHRRIWPVPTSNPNGSASGGSTPTNLDDAEIIRKASRAKNGDKFRRLWSGDRAGYSSHSEADLALCNYLAFWCGPDQDRIADLFAQSGLFRSKWQRDDYRQQTVALALHGRTEFYQPCHGRRRSSTNGDGHQAPPEIHEADDDPHRLARLFEDQHRVKGQPAHLWWREEYHRWDGLAYRPLQVKEVRAELNASIKNEFDRLNLAAIQAWEANGHANDNGDPVPKPTAKKVNTRLTADTEQALSGMTLLPSRVEPPAWLSGANSNAAELPANEIVVCKNGLFHLPSAPQTTLYPHTPGLFTLNALDYDFDPKAPAPAEWLKFLAKLWPDDQQSIDTLQEEFGYCLTPETRQQKIFMLIGPKRSGKGTIARVLGNLVGMANICAPTLASLGTNFGLSALLGKTLAIISDARLSGRTEAAVVIERLLSISGEDGQTVDRKYMSAVTARLQVRFWILTNELPRLNDPSGALVGRLVILRMLESWYGREDTALTDRLLKELPSILLWAIAGWQRLQARGHFVQPRASAELVQEMEDLASPISAFVRECCIIGPEHEVHVKDLFQRWKSWCDEKGRRESGNEQVFGRDLRAALPSLKVCQTRTDLGDRVRVYRGIRPRIYSDDQQEGRELEDAI